MVPKSLVSQTRCCAERYNVQWKKGRKMGLVPEKYRGTGEYFLVFNALVQAARSRGTVTYQELADLIGFPIIGDYMGTELGHLLGEISEDQDHLKRPMLSTVAVKVDGLPGTGFFDLAKKLGKYSGGDDKKEQHRFWEAETDRAYDLLQRRFSS